MLTKNLRLKYLAALSFGFFILFTLLPGRVYAAFREVPISDEVSCNQAEVPVDQRPGFNEPRLSGERIICSFGGPIFLLSLFPNSDDQSLTFTHRVQGTCIVDDQVFRSSDRHIANACLTQPLESGVAPKGGTFTLTQIREPDTNINQDSNNQDSNDFGPAFQVEAGCQDAATLNKDNCRIVYYIVQFTRILTGLVGVVVIMMVIIGGIQYSTAGGDPQAVANARKRIANALLALLLYIFTFAILQWLVPGGVF